MTKRRDAGSSPVGHSERASVEAWCAKNLVGRQPPDPSDPLTTKPGPQDDGVDQAETSGYRSSQPGFLDAIRATFLLFLQPLICFSR